MMSGINNVKISVLFHSVFPMSHFFNTAISRNVCISQKRNFLVIKDGFSITIFQKSDNQYHLNVTGIQSLSEVNQAVNWVIVTYCPSESFRYISHQVDNVTATYNFGYKLPLQKIACYLTPCRYNTERFPGLHMKSEKGAVIIFESGKVNIVGYSSEQEVVERWKSVKMKIESAVDKVQI